MARAISSASKRVVRAGWSHVTLNNVDNVDYPSFICEADRVPHETDPGYSVTEGVVEAAAVAQAVEEI
ncbi:hypothetical protein, partial [Mycolicibacterium fortuitum]